MINFDHPSWKTQHIIVVWMMKKNNLQDMKHCKAFNSLQCQGALNLKESICFD